MLSAAPFTSELLASAPGTANFTLSGNPSANGPYQTWHTGIGKIGSGQRAVPYVARTTTQFEVGVGYYDGGSPGTITRAAGLVQDSTAGRGTLVNFAAAPDVYCDLGAGMLLKGGLGGWNCGWDYAEWLFNQPVNYASSNLFAFSAGALGIGSVQISTGTSASGSNGITPVFNNAAVGSSVLVYGKSLLVYETNVIVNQALNSGTSADQSDVYLGFKKALSLNPSSEVEVAFACGATTDAQAGITAGHWAAKLFSYNSDAWFDTGVALDTSKYHNFRIEIRHDGSYMDFFIDGNNVVSEPVSAFPIAVPPGTILYGASATIMRTAGNTGTTARTMNVDSMLCGFIQPGQRN